MATNSTATHLFDGITDNKAPQMPKAAVILFLGLILWGLLFCGYYLLSGWSSNAGFDARMKAAQPATAPTSGVAR